MSDSNDSKPGPQAGPTVGDGASAGSSAGLDRRQALRRLVWVAPAIIGTASVRARAAMATCTPTCAPSCRP